MSDVSKTNEALIAEARRLQDTWKKVGNGFSETEFLESDGLAEIHAVGYVAVYCARRLADALEAATRVPVQGEPNDAVKAVIDRDVAIDAIAGGTISVPGGYGVLHGDDAANIVDAIIGHATVPDAATAALQRVRAIHANAGPSQGYDSRFKGGYGMLDDCCAACGSHGEYGVEWPCPTIAALEGAPEPEWEYGFELIEPDDRNVFEREGDFISAAFAYRAAKKRIDEEHQADLPRLQYLIVRRRKAGPWLPVEGERP